MTLPIPENAPASGRFTTVLPNGHRANIAILSDATPNGIVMMRMKHTSAAMAYPIASHRPASTNQMMLSTSLTVVGPTVSGHRGGQGFTVTAGRPAVETGVVVPDSETLAMHSSCSSSSPSS